MENEEVKKESPAPGVEVPRNLCTNIKMGYVQEKELFMLEFWDKLEENESLRFGVAFSQQDFENLTASMIKLIKDVNLKKAKKYQEDQDVKNQDPQVKTEDSSQTTSETTFAG